MCYLRNPRNINLFVRVPHCEDQWRRWPDRVYVLKFDLPFLLPTCDCDFLTQVTNCSESLAPVNVFPSESLTVFPWDRITPAIAMQLAIWRGGKNVPTAVRLATGMFATEKRSYCDVVFWHIHFLNPWRPFFALIKEIDVFLLREDFWYWLYVRDAQSVKIKSTLINYYGQGLEDLLTCQPVGCPRSHPEPSQSQKFVTTCLSSFLWTSLCLYDRMCLPLKFSIYTRS